MGFFRREQMDCCNYVESTGSRIVMDSDTNWMELESIQGNTTQFSTTGAQLLDVNAVGNYYINGQGNVSSNNMWIATDYIPVVAGQQYKLTTKDDKYLNAVVSFDIDKKLIGTILVDLAKTKGLFTALENAAYIRIRFYNDGGDFPVSMLEDAMPMLNAGATPKPWEPYTGGKPSPSPQYPQEIKGIGESGNINVTVAGAQLFDITKYSTSISQWIITDNRIAIENPTSTYLTIIYTIDVLPNTNYTLSSIIHNDVAGTNSMHIVVSIIKNTGEVISNVIIIDEASSSPKTFTVPEDGKQINVYIRNRTIGNGGYVENVMLNQGNTSLPWQPYYSPQNISITLTKPLYGIDNYNDEIAVTKRIDKCIEFTFNGSENWAVISTYEGFYYAGILPFTAMRRAGFCNQFPVDTKGEAIESIRIGNGNSVLFCVYSRFYDDTAADKGLAAWKAHLSTNPLKIVTYTNPEGYVETPLEQSNIDAIKSLYAYNGYTIVNNNENTNMKIMYKTKS